MAFNESEVVNDELQGWIGNNSSYSSKGNGSKDNNRSLSIMNSQDKLHPPQLQLQSRQQQPEISKKMIQQQQVPSHRCYAHAHPKSSTSK